MIGARAGDVRHAGAVRRPPEAVARPRPLVPLVIAAVVATFATTLVVIALRSPYTHSNLGGYDPAYTRTEQAVVGAPVPFRGEGAAAIRYPDEPTRGQGLWVSKGCVFCHSFAGRGGVFAPEMGGAPASKLREYTHEGPTGMPRYAEGALSDDELNAIVAYLRAASRR